ncbi:hypothetical protein [Falsiphaeobacter marinintestinus]|uniref:hypothetical protein n=1 Tax=Falsiphaeobacter marinintestinus TaxID=1492905 RepID=UPI001645A4F1|nr:hypothetical protein [Phaeobacter marinintestinus]
MEMLIWLIVAAATIIPMLKLLPHFGINKYWAIGCVLPVITIVLIWMMAMKLQEMETR